MFHSGGFVLTLTEMLVLSCVRLDVVSLRLISSLPTCVPSPSVCVLSAVVLSFPSTWHLAICTPVPHSVSSVALRVPCLLLFRRQIAVPTSVITARW